jgi:hypothetical protein
MLMVALATLAAGVVPARADSLTGEVVDLACYMVHPESGQGASHKKCAEMCAKKGMPLGLLTSDKQVYLLLEDHENEKPFGTVKAKAGEKVTVEGDKVAQGGLQGLVVESVK